MQSSTYRKCWLVWKPCKMSPSLSVFSPSSCVFSVFSSMFFWCLCSMSDNSLILLNLHSSLRFDTPQLAFFPSFFLFLSISFLKYSLYFTGSSLNLSLYSLCLSVVVFIFFLGMLVFYVILPVKLIIEMINITDNNLTPKLVSWTATLSNCNLITLQNFNRILHIKTLQ